MNTYSFSLFDASCCTVLPVANSQDWSDHLAQLDSALLLLMSAHDTHYATFTYRTGHIPVLINSL